VEDVLDQEKMSPRGRFYEARVPDTLDLSERARFSVNNLTHNVDPKDFYYVYQVINFGPKSQGPNRDSRTWDLTPKNARALPWMRTMCGSEEGLDRQYGMMKAMLSNVREDGLMYFPVDGMTPKDTSYPDVNGVLALACENHYASDGNRRWLDWIALLGTGLEKVAIRVDDRAYFPPESSIRPDGKWVWNLRGHATIPYNPPEEPYLEEQGLEGCVKFEQAYAMRALVRAHRYGRDEQSIGLVRKLTRFDMKPGMWENTTLEGYKGNEHGIFAGHFHGNTAALLALLDIAEIENDARLKEIVREAYDNAVRYGAARVGWFGGMIMPAKYERDPILARHTEGDSLGEMIELGLRLADAGLGEYWDDIDAVVRNQLIEQQFCDVELMRRVANGAPITSMLQDLAGGFTETPSLTVAHPEMYGCCSANGSIGLYYAWEGITRFHEGVATVNLLLNRASSWMDIDSYLPYEGKVELHNKQARTALVRIPSWVAMEEVKSFVNDSPAHPARSGRYLVFESLQGGATLRLEFPNPEVKEEHTIAGEQYQFVLRGSTVIDIEPRPKDPDLITLYQRAQYRAKDAPIRTTKRFVPDKILAIQ
jgi:hypothetical protein